MRTTLIIEDDLIEKASMLTGVKEKTSLVRMDLKASSASESGRKTRQTRRDREAPKCAQPTKSRGSLKWSWSILQFG